MNHLEKQIIYDYAQRLEWALKSLKEREDISKADERLILEFIVVKICILQIKENIF